VQAAPLIDLPKRVPTRPGRWRANVSRLASAVFVVLWLFGPHPLCFCPRHYIELSTIGFVPLVFGPRLYRYLGAAILVAGLVSAEGERTGAIHFEQEIRETVVRADLSLIRTQLASYKTANGAYPSTHQGLGALVAKPTSSPVPNHWTKLFLQVPKDPWQNEYVYRCPGTRHPDQYDLFSAGPDHVPYTADDDWGKRP
jgi:type II secretion system protein G